MRQFWAFVLLSLAVGVTAPTAAAQLTDILDIIDDAVVDRVEDSVVGDVVETVTATVEQTVAANVEQAVQNTLDQTVGENVSRSIENTVSRVVDGVVAPVTDRVVGGVVAPVLDPVLDPVLRATDPVLDPVLQPVLNTLTKKIEETFGKLPPVATPLREIPVEDNWRAVDNEWVALVAPEQLPALNVPAIRVIAATPLASTNQVMVRVAVSAQDNAAGRAQQVLRGLGATSADRNHVYVANSGASEDKEAQPEDPEPAPAPVSSRSAVRVGLIDTSLNRKHASLKTANITEKDFVDGKQQRPTAHGTGIASLLVGKEKGHEGLLPDGQLVSASVFYQGGGGATGATTSSLVASLDWMAQMNVKVVNMSLAGPPNEVLAAMIQKLTDRGMLVVAAVGNEGPASRPLYPAAFEPVVAVTAVDHESQIYRWANQGPQVDLAAWGVASKVARDKGGYADQSGTSYAAPIVSARLAQAMANGAKSTSAALKTIISAAEDLGTKGRDNTYGYGLIK